MSINDHKFINRIRFTVYSNSGKEKISRAILNIFRRLCDQALVGALYSKVRRSSIGPTVLALLPKFIDTSDGIIQPDGHHCSYDLKTIKRAVDSKEN